MNETSTTVPKNKTTKVRVVWTPANGVRDDHFSVQVKKWFFGWRWFEHDYHYDVSFATKQAKQLAKQLANPIPKFEPIVIEEY